MADEGAGSVAYTAEAHPDGVVVSDGAGTVTVLNQVAARMLQVPASAGVGLPLSEVLRLQDSRGRDWLGSNRPFHALAIQTGVPEQEWLLPDGASVLVTARVLRHEPCGPIAGLGIALRPGRGRARLDRERSDLVATVAHELRSPLTGVKSFVQALLQRWDRLSDEQKKLILTTVHSDAERLTRLITELLDVARIDTCRLRLDLRPVPVGATLEHVVASATAAGSRPVEVAVPDGLPDVRADRDKFSQVFGNLVENALRHGDGTVRVAAEVTTDGAGAPAVRVTVDDEGDGIPEEIRRRVFTKFWTRGEGASSGLGMYLVQGLVRAHGGTVELDDAPGGGTRASVLWPADGGPGLGAAVEGAGETGSSPVAGAS